MRGPETTTWQITSVASMAIYLVIVCGMLVIPFGMAALILSYILGQDTLASDVAFWVVVASWSLVALSMWRHFVRTGRRWGEPRLNTREFFLIQVSTALCVLGFTFLLRIVPNDVPFFPSVLQTMFNVILILLNATYFSLVWAMGYHIPAKSYGGALAMLIALAIGRVL